MTLKVTSRTFSEGAAIPREHTCDGANRSPLLAWSGVSEKSQSVALVGMATKADPSAR